MVQVFKANSAIRVEDNMQVMFDDEDYDLLVLKSDYDALQAKIDALMLEYCPDEVTDEQWEEYCKHQVRVDINGNKIV